MLFAILNAQGAFLELREYAAEPVAKPGRVLPVVIDPEPVYDADTQRLVRGAPIVEAARVRLPWVIVALDATERLRRQIDGEREQIVALVQDLKAGTGTAGERLQRVERALAHVITRLALGLAK